MSKISQHKLLNLSHNSINQLTFLAEQEKEKLPVILENYIEEHRDFKEISEMIKTETIPPPWFSNFKFIIFFLFKDILHFSNININQNKVISLLWRT